MEDYREVFNNKRNQERWAYERKINKLEKDYAHIDGALVRLRRDGIVLLQHSDVNGLFKDYDINLYKICEAKCKQWGRPYIKCVQTDERNIVVSVTGTGPARGLVANLLMAAEPIVPSVEYSKKLKKDVVREPEVMELKGMNYSDADIRVWATARTVTILFQNYAGLRQFNDWWKFCITDRMQRLYLGL